ncbi:MAG: hypothetical protein E2O53_01135 [Gammaproteobacteria bacterium]|nr:MAG: hypothetical protein E2O53_01135 [Gammaproteobacteria bacterium]
MKAILRSGFLALAIMAFAVAAYAGPYEDGLAAYEREDDGETGLHPRSAKPEALSEHQAR